MPSSSVDKELKILKEKLEAKSKKFNEIKEAAETKSLISRWMTVYGQNPLDLVVAFIKEKGLKLYGGKALHEHLVKFKRGFYSANEFPDYDVFSPNAWKHAKELADRLHKAGFAFVEAKGSVLNDEGHQTYKVSVEMTYVLDLTQEGCPRDDMLAGKCGGCAYESELSGGKCIDIFNAIPANDLMTYNPQKKGEIPKVYKKTYDFDKDTSLYPDCLFVASPEYLKISLGRELSEPLSFPDRLPKIGTRNFLFNKFFKFDPSVCKMGEHDEMYRMGPPTEEMKKILDFILEWSNKHELIHYGTYAYNFFIRGQKGVKYPKLHVNDYEMYSPDAVMDAVDLANALKKKFKKYEFVSFMKTQHWKEVDAISAEVLIKNGDEGYTYLAELTEYNNCFPYLQYGGVRYAGIEKMLNIYRRSYVMRPLVEATTVLTKNYECMLATLLSLYQKKKSLTTRGRFKIISSHCTGRERSKIVENLRLKLIKKEEELKKTTIIVDYPKKGKLTKITPMPAGKIELPYYPAHKTLKRFLRKDSSNDNKTKKKGRVSSVPKRRKSTKFVKVKKALSI